MATPSTGIVVTFNGVAALEVTELQWTFGGSMPQGRNTTWVSNFGTATIGTIGSNVSSALLTLLPIMPMVAVPKLDTHVVLRPCGMEPPNVH